MNNNYLLVSDINNYIKMLLDKDMFLGNVYVKGEISNFKYHSRGHFYFTLKDDNSRINAVMFASYASKIDFNPKDGDKVLVVGRVCAYPASGSYQIYVSQMSLDGIGKLFIEYEKLKKRLASEGLFDKSHKKAIVKYPNKVGVITADTGAAIKDIVSTIKRRYPICQVILFPSLVQGQFAKDSIVKQIRLADSYNLDTLIVGRGGGSIEDLWAFNEEEVARAIYECKTPIISAVGHEIDFTIADFVADLRAPTPTGAAEMCVPTIMDTQILINNFVIRLNKNIKNMVNQKFITLERFKRSYILKNPTSMYEIKEQKLDNLFDNLNNNINLLINNKTNRLENVSQSYILKNPSYLINESDKKLSLLINSLTHLNPLEILDKGYSIIKKGDKLIKNAKDVKTGDIIDIKLSKGDLKAKVMEVNNGK